MAPSTPLTDAEPVPVPITATQSLLLDLPLPLAPVPVAVYGFEDKTGQFKPQENVQTLSRAVSQGGDAILIKALRDAGNGGWFRVLERAGLDNLLKERKIIREMRSRYLGEKEFNPNALPPLLFAGVILEGGIVGFDSNTLTGGVGARFLGVGGDVKYRQNSVTVNLRAVSVKTGEVLANVTTAKTIASVGLQGGVFKYVSFDELLELEAGITNNEPDTLALRRTIEKTVHALIVEGSETGLWAFADEEAGAALVAAREAEQYGEPLPSKVAESSGQNTGAAPTLVAEKAKPAPAVAKTPVKPIPAEQKTAVAQSKAAPVRKQVVASRPENAAPKAPVAKALARPQEAEEITIPEETAASRVAEAGYAPVSMADLMTAIAAEAESAQQPGVAALTGPAIRPATDVGGGTN